LNIHYIHEKVSEEAKEKKHVYPLLLLHGWPGSVREFFDFIPMLTKHSNITDYAFEVVAPSLVGYGWSDVSVICFSVEFLHFNYYYYYYNLRLPRVPDLMPLKWPL